MPSNPTLPEAVRERVTTRLIGARVRFGRDLGSAEIVEFIAPLIIEWARKDQAEVDAQVANRIRGSHYPYTMGWDSAERIADAIRAQFEGEDTP